MKQIKIVKNITNRDEESFNLYLKDVAKIPLLTPEEESELWEKIVTDGDSEAKDKIVTSNLRFVISCAKYFQGQGLSLGDLVAEGNYGLLKAVNRFDPTKGVKFISYAVNWIEQAMIEALSCTSRTIRLPVSHLNDRRKIHNVALKLEQELERTASTSEIADIVGMEEDKVIKTLGTNTNCTSLDTPFENTHDDTTCLLDIIPNGFESADHEVNSNDVTNSIKSALDSIPIRSRCIIKMFFGLGVNQITLEEIGDYFGLTSERVRQLKDEALINMKKYLTRNKLIEP